uniref:SMODS and SLOG-associating 2TM effector domain-containing protein n=1 Tax=Candidatus Kentrum sp. FM TaxID=2126340 RepID=A0A450TDN0_9GAMM|nr:MAG: hypothetical protein BECKFM1743C_GA0114222_103852 [Candidatus Kentron sp. FM]VFJ67273.1 MAG: hypothetical protein BECKFM1743A_GA0114220_104423 [Candidatus Kentron sp. FM]VFK11852.1 MAG: hypothetical protein BECKFM1743B_GA0114221_102112 [Candidatus Kentron sp. FM]
MQTATGKATRTKAESPATDREKECPGRDNQTIGAATTTASEEISNILFDCERLSMYHAIRRDFWDKLHRLSLFLVVLAGTASFAAISEELDIWWLPLMAPLFGLASVVFDFSGHARIHENLCRRFTIVHGEALTNPDDVKTLQTKIHEIYADEPPTYRALDAWSHNLACKGRGQEKWEVEISPIHLALKNLWPFWFAEYPKKSSIAE